MTALPVCSFCLCLCLCLLSVCLCVRVSVQTCKNRLNFNLLSSFFFLVKNKKKQKTIFLSLYMIEILLQLDINLLLHRYVVEDKYVCQDIHITHTITITHTHTHKPRQAAPQKKEVDDVIDIPYHSSFSRRHNLIYTYHTIVYLSYYIH